MTTEPNEARLARVRTSWDERAPRWDERAGAAATTPDHAAEAERTIAALGIGPGERVLDAGCGTGQWAIAFAERGCEVTGVDLAPEMIRRAERHAAERGVAVDWRVGDAAHLSEPFAVYHAVHARVVLQFVPDVPATLREFRRVLRPGGRLLASVPGMLSPIYRGSWRRHVPGAPPEVNWLVPWELERLLDAEGWTLLDGWGEWGRDLTNEPNPFDPGRLAGLDRQILQASATTWCVVAR